MAAIVVPVMKVERARLYLSGNLPGVPRAIKVAGSNDNET